MRQLGCTSCALQTTERLIMQNPTGAGAPYITSFCHLRTTTDFSLDGSMTTKQLVKRAASLNYQALGMIDSYSSLSSIPEFLRETKKANLKPIIGANLFVSPDNAPYSPDNITLIVENEIGWQNLVYLNNIDQQGQCLQDSEGNKCPRSYVKYSQLKDHLEGLICLTGVGKHSAFRFMEQGDLSKAAMQVQRLVEIFGPANLYLEITDHGRSHTLAEPHEWHDNIITDHEICQHLFQLSAEFGIKTVATGDCKYETPEDMHYDDAWVAHGQKKDVLDKDRYSRFGYPYHIQTPDEMIQTFQAYPQSILSTLEIANRVTFTELAHHTDFVNPTTEQDHNMLKNMCLKGLVDKLGALPQNYLDRLDHELQVISARGETKYVLVVHDIVQYAKSIGALEGPGRGSAAGSLVLYSLGITHVDPITHDLLFERFITTESMGGMDIDLDFSATHRQQIEIYLQEKYAGLQIITFGRYGGRSAVRTAAQILTKPYLATYNKIAAHLHKNPWFSLKVDIENSQELQKMLQEGEGEAEVLKLALWLEGKISSRKGVHAAGILLDTPQTLPIAQVGNKKVSSFEMKETESLNIKKQDVLSLRYLDHIQNTLAKLKAKGTELDPYQLPVDDKNTFELFKQEKTVGVFQFDSKGMRNTCKIIQPDTFQDLIAIVALYRPGPMDNIPVYAKRKNGAEAVEIPECLKPILGPTYGLFIYQEQLMQIAKDIAGFTANEADNLRKAIGKKLMDKMTNLKPVFIQGCKTRTPELSEKDIDELWQHFLTASDYSFNKSHAASYAHISYVTAYLKSNYPKEYLDTLIESNPGKDKLAEYQAELDSLKVSYSIL